MTTERTRFINSITPPGLFVLLLITVKTIEYVLGIDLVILGVYPRNINSIFGIITAPLIHKNAEHLLSNIFPLLVLGTSIKYFYPDSSKKIFLISYLGTNFFVWIFARESYHIGASGIVYTLVSFMFFSGIIKKDRRSTALSLLVVFLYGGLIIGVFPIREEISWESHLIGGVIGLLAAIVFRKRDLYNRHKWEEELPEDDIRNLEISYKKGYQGTTKDNNEDSN